MPARRDFLRALALAPLAAQLPAYGAVRAGRIALAIGNEAYAASPLANPVNDARAVADLLRGAGFSVDLQTNAGFQGMAEAIDRFATAVRHSETRMAVFYYAGHGAQVDWRNYLLPVDAAVRSAEELKSRCIELNRLLQQFAELRDKTFVVILDACRDNPFGSAYRPEARGLSPFDAPVGSLLAYATAPGQVAFDGEAGNGLYTANLVRELAQRGARIEDCLKRVRLNVRLASQGAQIPWESTSLESDVYLFADARPEMGEAELERLFSAELETWNRIKTSQKSEDWVAYLRVYPNGRFSEVAQARLVRLLADVERRSPAAPPVKSVRLETGVQAGPLFRPGANPYSVGTHPLGRNFSVGDQAEYRQSDLLTGVVEGTRRQTVSRVDVAADVVEYNGGSAASDLLGNPLRNARRSFDGPLQLVPAELQLGKRWLASAVATGRGGRHGDVEYKVRVAALEVVTVPAGQFHAFRIEADGWNYGSNAKLERRLWVVPGLNFNVRFESVTRNPRGALVETLREELVSLRQAG